VNERYEVAERAVAAYRALADLAETVEDEWQYVTDVVDAYLPTLQALGDSDSTGLTAGQAAAVDEAIAEIALITDPHKAIDWLSTFPHVVALALGGDVDRPAGEGGSGAGGASSDADDDSPFGMLRGLR